MGLGEYMWAKPRDWDQSRWAPGVVAVIEAWGESLRWLDDVIISRLREEYSAAVERLVQVAREPVAPELAEGREPEPGRSAWAQFVDDVFAAAGMRTERLEATILYLTTRFSRGELSYELIEVEDKLFPEDAGITAAHLLAITGDRRGGMSMLVDIVNDEGRRWQTRCRAFECLLELNAFGLQAPSDEPYRRGSGGCELEALRLRLAPITIEPWRGEGTRRRRRSSQKRKET